MHLEVRELGQLRAQQTAYERRVYFDSIRPSSFTGLSRAVHIQQ